jgi:transaldolase/glucose-6-phosphate isomerase
MSDNIQKLTAIGQSLWLDNIQRRLLEAGELAAMVARGDVRGVTSNPSIFQNAIAKTHDYDAALVPLAWSGWDAERIFWQLAEEDIRAATDVFLPLYEESEGSDGYVSIEVSPLIANDTEATVAQARELWEKIAHPNLMVKIPATKAGIPAIRRSIASGLNINVTLIFSLTRYAEVMDAYLSGLEDRLAAGRPIDHVASVASFFVSRVDTKVDDRLPVNSPLRGKAAVANAKLAYEAFRHVFGSERFAKLQMQKARIQRPLWASTSTKNPAYPDTLYVDELIGPATVNTVPPQTLEAFREHGKAEETLTRDVEKSREEITAIEREKISMDQVTQELEDEGVKAFADAFEGLLKTIDERRKDAVDKLGPLAAPVSKRIAKLEVDSVSARLRAGDPTLWTKDAAGQAEVKIRLGWLKSPETSREAIPEIRAFADELHRSGIGRVLLLGMGGSSLAPEVFSLVMTDAPGAGNFAILDSTDPAQVAAVTKRFPPEQTLFIVSSKSGETAEVSAFFNYFWERSERELGKRTGEHFIAITDPGTPLQRLALERGFRKIFLADQNVGGRYSVLTHFGLVPAGLMGVDLTRLLASAARMESQCAASAGSDHHRNIPAARNPGLVLGAVIGEAALGGRDKLTLIADPALAPFGSWLEQLIAESSGKKGKGIVPVDGEPVGKPGDYANDRLFVYLRRDGKHDSAIAALQKAGRPVVIFTIDDSYDLGGEFYRWEVAIAVACAVMGVNAFDQPDVQDSKDRTKSKIAAFAKKGELDVGKPAWKKGQVRIYSRRKVTANSFAKILADFLSKSREGDYVAINAYLPRDHKMHGVLQKLRKAIRAKTGCATMVGFGPRFQHSTGQLHKGGPNSGLFLQITADPIKDIEIPTQDMTFGVMERAQALGDYEALAARGRRILRVHLPSVKEIELLMKALK